MANIGAAQVTVIRSWDEGHITLKTGQVVSRKAQFVELDTSAVNAGGTTNLIPATAFGLTVIESCSMGVQNSATVRSFYMAPDWTGANINAYNLENATDATRMDPVDVTVDVRLTIKGY